MNVVFIDDDNVADEFGVSIKSRMMGVTLSLDWS